MKYDVTQRLSDHRGRPIRQNENDKQGATLRDVLEFVCQAPNDALKTAEEKVRVYRVLQRITKDEQTLELDPEEVGILKRVIAAIYPAVLVGVLFDILGDGKEAAKPN